MLLGTFSTVYLACLKEDPSKCYALKHILETSVAWRIENELKCLTIMRSVIVLYVKDYRHTHTDNRGHSINSMRGVWFTIYNC